MCCLLNASIFFFKKVKYDKIKSQKNIYKKKSTLKMIFYHFFYFGYVFVHCLLVCVDVNDEKNDSIKLNQISIFFMNDDLNRL